MTTKPLVSIMAAILAAGMPGVFAQAAPAPEKYLAFQIFTCAGDSEYLSKNFPPLAENLADEIGGLVRAIGTTGSPGRKLGFIVGPMTFDQTDDQVRQLMRESFVIAIENNVAVGFHIDDSMFWGRLAELNQPENIEWLDWNQTPDTGRRLDWSRTPTKIMPALCFNSPAVVAAAKNRAALIGEEAVRGMKMLHLRGRDDLFIGLIAGAETQMGRDFDTGKYPGYHALANEGFSAAHPPADLDQARVEIVRNFADLWATSLAAAGVPDDKIYSHIAFISRTSFDAGKFGQPGRFPGDYLETVNFTPPSVAFGAHRRAGFSTYPQFGFLEQIQGELAKNGNPPWASAEGTAGDPAVVGQGDPGGSMEHYLGNLFSRGAVLVNVFGWGVGPTSNPFRKIAEGPNSIAAYQKFLRGDELASDPPAQVPSTQFFGKMRKLQQELPPYIASHGPEKVAPIYHELSRDLHARHYVDAEHAVDEIFQAMGP
jgi:hypothetical protein